MALLTLLSPEFLCRPWIYRGHGGSVLGHSWRRGGDQVAQDTGPLTR